MRPKIAKWARQALFFVVGALAGYGVAHLTRHHDVSLIVGLSLLFSVFAVVTIVHELGHVAGARIAGWKVHLVAVGPLLFRTSPPRVSLAARMIGGDVGGFVLAIPKPGQGWRDGAFAFYSGGIVACLVLAAVAGGVYLASEAAGWSDVLSKWSLMLAVFSFLFGAAVDAIPFRTEAGTETDGASILQHLRGQDMPGPMQTVMMLIGHAMAGIRPRDWDPRLVAKLRGIEVTGQHGGMVMGTLYAWYLDVRDFPAAEAALARSVELLGRMPSLLIEEAFLAAHLHGDGERARRVLDEVPKKGMFEQHARWRAEAATRLASGDAAGTAEAVAAARKALASPLFTATDDDRDILDEIERRAAALADGKVAERR